MNNNFSSPLSPKENIIAEKSREFAVRVINLYKYLAFKKNERVMSKQLLRSGTSIGANIHEGDMAISKAEFAVKLQISLKEANETSYWLYLLYRTEYINELQYMSIDKDCQEILRLLISILKTIKTKTDKAQ